MDFQNPVKCPDMPTEFQPLDASEEVSWPISPDQFVIIATPSKAGMLSPQYKKLKNVGMERLMTRRGYLLWFTLLNPVRWISLDGTTRGIFNLRRTLRK